MKYNLNAKTVLFQASEFSISTKFSSIWPIDRGLSGTTASSQKRKPLRYVLLDTYRR